MGSNHYLKLPAPLLIVFFNGISASIRIYIKELYLHTPEIYICKYGQVPYISYPV